MVDVVTRCRVSVVSCQCCGEIVLQEVIDLVLLKIFTNQVHGKEKMYLLGVYYQDLAFVNRIYGILLIWLNGE